MTRLKLYIATLRLGTNHNEWKTFYDNLSDLNAKAPGYRGFSSIALFAHHEDISTVSLLVAHGISEIDDITVEEITLFSSNNDPNHAVHSDLINGYFGFVTLV